MCGICGVVQLGGDPRPVVSSEVLDRMTDVMEHRGPDDRGTHRASGIALGVRRLSIVDVEGGHQPVSSEDGLVWAVQNGELYNHGELRVRLAEEGHLFFTRCDTEVLPHLYERYGADYPKHLRGKFATAVWDATRRRLVVARDRLGIKPLYFARVDDRLVFASELKSLLASGLVGTELDYEAIDAYLALGFVPGPATPLAGVSKLLPGHRLIADATGVAIDPYWTPPEPMVKPVAGSKEEYAERLLAELEEAVRLRLMSDVPLGAMLSGGLDSSLVVALMARHMSEPVKTFSVGFAGLGPENELPDARLVAATFGTDHHELELSLDEAGVDLAELVWCLDEPLADLSALGFYALSELAARHVTVALSGQGADELLGGYERYRTAALADRWRQVPGPVRSTCEWVAARGPSRLKRAAYVFGASDVGATVVAAKDGWAGAADRARLVRGRLRELDGGAARRAIEARLDGFRAPTLPTTLYVDGQLGLVDDMLHYFDRASMAHSLEVRVPFLDHHVVEFCAAIPPGLKVRGLTTKYLLKHAARGLVPDRVIEKRKIGFFNAAVDAWFSRQLDGPIGDYLLGGRPRYAELLDRREVERLVASRREAANGRLSRLLLSILMLEVWLSTYLPRALGAAPASCPR